MTSPRASRSRTSRPWWAAGGLAAMLLLGPPAGAQSQDDVLLAPTPLILKDGRIANVSVHVVPFAAGAAEVADPAARGLAVLTRDAATDCFLTAQVIGHVGASEIGSNETLTAHRLARARADAVQASLIGGGLPANAIASVWDWQFMVQEARATLWMFSLIAGEDCEGEPLMPGAAVVAQSELAPPEPEPAGPPTSVARAADPPPASRGAPASQRAAAAPPPQAAAAAPPAQEVTPVAPRPSQQTAAVVPRPVDGPAPVAAVPAGPAPIERATAGSATPVPAISPREPSVARTEPVPSRAAPAPSHSMSAPNQGAPAVAALQQRPGPNATSGKAAPAQNEAGGVSDAGDGAVAIIFATNSSYLPPGTSQRLKALVAELAAGRRYRVRLQAAVSGSDSVVGASSAAEAARYNKWLAERRLERVTTWLQESVKDRELIIEPQFLAGDSSRRVIVEISPAG